MTTTHGWESVSQSISPASAEPPCERVRIIPVSGSISNHSGWDPARASSRYLTRDASVPSASGSWAVTRVTGVPGAAPSATLAVYSNVVFTLLSVLDRVVAPMKAGGLSLTSWTEMTSCLEARNLKQIKIKLYSFFKLYYCVNFLSPNFILAIQLSAHMS